MGLYRPPLDEKVATLTQLSDREKRTSSTGTSSPKKGPLQPKTLGLNKLMHAHYSLRAGAARSRGFHPSEIFRSCPVLQWFIEQAWNNLASEDPKIIQEAYSFLQEKFNKNERRFSSAVKSEFSYGHSIHEDTQYKLGFLGVLWGRWKCPNCKYVTPTERSMPRMTVQDVNGDPLLDAALCCRCKSNFTEIHPWIYVEPAVYDKDWNIVGHCDGVIIVIREGVTYKYVLEIKSAHEAKFEGKWKPLPIKEHVEQASMYSMVLDIPHIYFIYVDKNAPSRWKEIVVSRDTNAVADAKNFVKAVQWGDSHDQPPLYARVCPEVVDARAKNCVACEKCFGKKPPPNWWDTDGSKSG